MNSNDCKLKIKVCYKDKNFEDESKNIIPLQKIKEKAIKEFDIKKEDEEFINFEYHSNKDNKNNQIENEDNIIQYSNEDSSGNLFCKLELVINNPKTKTKDNNLSNEAKVEKIESKKSSDNIISFASLKNPKFNFLDLINGKNSQDNSNSIIYKNKPPTSTQLIENFINNSSYGNHKEILQHRDELNKKIQNIRSMKDQNKNLFKNKFD